MQKPSVGRIVRYKPSNDSLEFAAMIVHVINDELVNLTVFDHDGSTEGALEVSLGTPSASARCWYWPTIENKVTAKNG